MSERLRVLEELGSQLERAARRAPDPRRRRPGVVVPVLGVLVALVLAAAAVLAIGHRGASPGHRSAAVPAGAQAFVRELAVLRRPQSAADRLLPAAVAPTLPGRIVPAMTRLLASVKAGRAGSFRIYLVVLHAGGCRIAAPAGSALVPAGYWTALVTVNIGGPGAVYGPGGWGHEIQYAARAAAIVPLFPAAGDYQGTVDGEVYATLVPDGVRGVTWLEVAGGRGQGTVAVRPSLGENIAYAVLDRPPGTRAVTWRFAGGRVERATRPQASAPRFCATTPGYTPGARRPIAASLRRDFALLRGALPPRALSIGAFYAGIFAPYARLNFAQARFVPTHAGFFGARSGVWVVPGSNGLCLMEGTRTGYAGGNGVCGDTRAQARGPASRNAAPGSGQLRFSDRLGHGRNAYFGLVPDGNRAVSVLLPGGARRRVPVHDNVYAFAVHGRALALQDRDAAGRPVRVALYVNQNMF